MNVYHVWAKALLIINLFNPHILRSSTIIIPILQIKKLKIVEVK